MRDITTARTGGTAPLPGETPPAAKQQVQPGEVQHAAQIAGDSLSARAVTAAADAAARVTIGDPVAEAVKAGAKTLARLVLAANDQTAIERVKAKLELKSDDELREIGKGKGLSDEQYGKLDAHEKGLLLDAATHAGAQAALEAITSRSDSG